MPPALSSRRKCGNSEEDSLKLEIATLKETLAIHQANIAATLAQASDAQALAAQAQEEAKLWESLATETELTQAQLKAELAALQAQAAEKPQDIQQFLTNAKTASQKVELDEAATRLLIDEQLRAAGWEAE